VENHVVIDLGALVEIAFYVAVLTAPIVVFNRWLGGADGPSLADILALPVDPAWPRGVQEEEPVRWRLEALRPYRSCVEPRRADGQSPEAMLRVRRSRP
jgi:hypothetical protein